MIKVLVCLLSGLLVGWLVFVSGSSRTPIPKPPPASSPFAESADVEPDGRVQGLQLVEQADMNSVWEVYAGEVAWYATSQRATMHRIRARVFQAEMPPICLDAEYGQVARATGDMSVTGQVRLQHLAGYTVTTDTLHWQAADRVLYTDDPVQIVSATVRIRGVGFRSKIAQRRFMLQRNVRASLRLD